MTDARLDPPALEETQEKLEVLATPDDYDALKPYIKLLRNKWDPAPVMIDPYPDQYLDHHYEKGQCPLNVVEYIAQHGGEAVKGFKTWKMQSDLFGPGLQMTAQVHCVVKQANGKYLDVTPPENGDEGQRLIFVPSSHIYPSFSVEDLVQLHRLTGGNARMGKVYAPNHWLALGQISEPAWLAKGNADELELLLCPNRDAFGYLSRKDRSHISLGSHEGYEIVWATSFLRLLNRKGKAPVLSKKTGMALSPQDHKTA